MVRVSEPRARRVFPHPVSEPGGLGAPAGQAGILVHSLPPAWGSRAPCPAAPQSLGPVFSSGQLSPRSGAVCCWACSVPLPL